MSLFLFGNDKSFDGDLSILVPMMNYTPVTTLNVVERLTIKAT